jgi:hypothetical protein
MKLSQRARNQFKKFGADGGKARAGRLSAAQRKSIARRAAMKRWIRQRFGANDFASLGLPGGELIDTGLADLARNEATPESFAVSLAASRLHHEGVPVRVSMPNPEQGLYDALCKSSGDLAHERYGAYLAQVASFADALRSNRLRGRAS